MDGAITAGQRAAREVAERIAAAGSPGAGAQASVPLKLEPRALDVYVRHFNERQDAGYHGSDWLGAALLLGAVVAAAGTWLMWTREFV